MTTCADLTRYLLNNVNPDIYCVQCLIHNTQTEYEYSLTLLFYCPIWCCLSFSLIVYSDLKYKRTCTYFLDRLLKYVEAFGDSVIKRMNWISNKRLNPATSMCLFQAKIWISNLICRRILYSMSWCESWLVALMILMELLTLIVLH